MLKILTWSWKAARIHGTEIRFHYSILFTILAAYFILRPTDLRGSLITLLAVLGFLLSIFSHEVGHTVAAKLAGIEVQSIVVWLLGGFTNLSREPEKPLPRLAIYVAGPLVTTLLGVLFFVIYVYLSLNTVSLGIYIYARICLFLATLNGILLLFNILPVYPLDGGQILHALSEMFFGKIRANSITMIISIPVLLLLIMFGVRTGDYLLLASSVFIALAIGTLNRHTLRWITLGLNYLTKRGGYYFLQGDYDRALQFYTRDIQREPKQANHYLARGIIYLWLLEKEKALADINRALEISPNNAVALTILGDIYSLDHDYDAALGLFSKAKELNPKWAPPYIDSGSVLLDKGECEQALEELNKGISLSPNIAQAYVARSRVHYRLGDLESMHKDQDQSIRLSEKDALTRADFALEDYKGYLDWAEDFYGRVLQTLPHSWYAYQGRGDAYHVHGKYGNASRDYSEAIQLNPREATLYLKRGKSYRAKEEIDCAVADFRQVLQLTNKTHLQRQAEELLNACAGK